MQYYLGHGQRKMWLSWVHFWLVWVPKGGPLASQMVDLGCQDKDWLGGRGRDVLDTILLRNGLILAPLGMDKGNVVV